MPSHPSTGRAPGRPADHGALDALISQARRLRGGLLAARREVQHGTAGGDAERTADPGLRRRHALFDLALHHLRDLEGRLDRLREAPCPAPGAPGPRRHDGPAAPVGDGEWNLLEDEAAWSEELFPVFGRAPAEGPLLLDELPSRVVPEDRPALTEALTDCLVAGKPVDGRFRIVRPDGSVRTVRMTGAPVLGADGGATSVRAVFHDADGPHRDGPAPRGPLDASGPPRPAPQDEHRLATALQEAVLPSWRDSVRLPHGGPAALRLAARYLPSATGALTGGSWYDALELPGGGALLSTGGLTGHGVEAVSEAAALLGAARGMAVAGVDPGPLMGHLNQLLDFGGQPVLCSAVCCRYESRARALRWAQAGPSTPLLFRAGTGRVLRRPGGVLLGASSGAVYGQHDELLEPGDLLVLHTDGLVPDPAAGTARLLSLAPRLAAAGGPGECADAIAEEFDGPAREDEACVLVARVGD